MCTGLNNVVNMPQCTAHIGNRHRCLTGVNSCTAPQDLESSVCCEVPGCLCPLLDCSHSWHATGGQSKLLRPRIYLGSQAASEQKAMCCQTCLVAVHNSPYWHPSSSSVQCKAWWSISNLWHCDSTISALLGGLGASQAAGRDPKARS